jgi:hypothetical protein
VPKTPEQKIRDNAARRKRWHERTRRDPEWRAQYYAKQKIKRERARSEDPIYATLEKLWKRKTRLRESIKYHQDTLAKRDKELVATVAKIQKIKRERNARIESRKVPVL